MMTSPWRGCAYIVMPHAAYLVVPARGRRSPTRSSLGRGFCYDRQGRGGRACKLLLTVGLQALVGLRPDAFSIVDSGTALGVFRRRARHSWFLAHFQLGADVAPSGSEQSPQSWQSKSVPALAACSSAWAAQARGSRPPARERGRPPGRRGGAAPRARTPRACMRPLSREENGTRTARCGAAASTRGTRRSPCRRRAPSDGRARQSRTHHRSGDAAPSRTSAGGCRRERPRQVENLPEASQPP